MAAGLLSGRNKNAYDQSGMDVDVLLAKELETAKVEGKKSTHARTHARMQNHFFLSNFNFYCDPISPSHFR